jgi:SOS-response transcriptional repressor LexA
VEQEYVEVYDFIVAYKAKRGYSPSLDDIADGLQISRGAIFHLLEQMERQGMIVQPRGFLRAIKLLSRTPNPIRVVPAPQQSA